MSTERSKMDEKVNLKPCPFCGSKAYMWQWNGGTVIQCEKFNSTYHVIWWRMFRAWLRWSETF